MITLAVRELQSAAGQGSEPGTAHGRLERRWGPARLTRVCATDLGLAKEQAVPSASTAETKKTTPPGRRKTKTLVLTDVQQSTLASGWLHDS